MGSESGGAMTRSLDSSSNSSRRGLVTAALVAAGVAGGLRLGVQRGWRPAHAGDRPPAPIADSLGPFRLGHRVTNRLAFEIATDRGHGAGGEAVEVTARSSAVVTDLH